MVLSIVTGEEEVDDLVPAGEVDGAEVALGLDEDADVDVMDRRNRRGGTSGRDATGYLRQVGQQGVEISQDSVGTYPLNNNFREIFLSLTTGYT